MRLRSKNVPGIVLTLLLFSILIFSVCPAAGAATAGIPMNADEQQMTGLINQARINAGLAPLTVDRTLSGLARDKAGDMASNGYFSHYSPTYGSPFDMMKADGLTFTYAGENLAKAPTVASAFKALMASSGHRSNILNKNFDKVGIGVVTSGSYKIVVQMFTGGRKNVISAVQPQPAPKPQPKPAPQPAPAQGLNADEQKMLDLVNTARIKAGLSSLQIDMDLVKLARLKALDMIENNYFGHTSPTYGSPFDMISAAGIKYSYAGENLAGAPNVETAYNNLMNSPGHRANIMNANFTKIGIGVVDGGPYGKIFVQMFIG